MRDFKNAASRRKINVEKLTIFGHRTAQSITEAKRCKIGNRGPLIFFGKIGGRINLNQRGRTNDGPLFYSCVDGCFYGQCGVC